MTAPFEVRYRPHARSDLDEIFWYIVDVGGSPGAALTYLRRIEARCRRIGDAPRAGRMRDDLCPGLRTVSFERTAVICYVVEDGKVWITNIFRRGRDYEAILRDDREAEQD